MWSKYRTARLSKEIEEIAKSKDFSRRADAPVKGALLDILDSVNRILAEAEMRDAALREKLAELMDARDDAQTANQLLRRLKNELKARSGERDAALRRAEAANEAKSQFLANMSHEIRTPMHGILGLAEVLSRTSLEARQMSLVQTIQRSGTGLLTIINDVLDFSKIESGNVEFVTRPFSLRSCIDDLVNTLAPRFEKKGIEFIVRVGNDLPDSLVGDHIRIRQVVTNLIDNALKFTDRGYVLLDVDGQFAASQFTLHLSVQDSGIGIPKEKIESIFEKFNQADNSSTRRHEGTGLGLAISRMLVERMKGRIDVSSAIGHGSTFAVSLPLPIHDMGIAGCQARPARPSETLAAEKAAPAPAPDTNIVPLAGGPYQRPRVLLVEDNVVNQEVAREYLGDMGCLVTLAVTGRESVAHYVAEHFDLILMDCLMPDMDGFQATRAIREIEARSGRAHTPVIALTANAFDRDRENCIAAGMDDFQSKPFTFEELQVVVKKWLPDKLGDGKGKSAVH